MEGKPIAINDRENMPSERLFGLFSVEENRRDARAGLEECREIIHDFLSNIGIKAARADAGMQHIPQCDLILFQQGDPFLIRRHSLDLQQPGHYPPELILRMGVILVFHQ